MLLGRRARRGGRGAGALQGASRRDAAGVFAGGGLTNEKAYVLGKFARVALRTLNVDYNGRFCMSSAATASRWPFGMGPGHAVSVSLDASTSLGEQP